MHEQVRFNQCVVNFSDYLLPDFRAQFIDFLCKKHRKYAKIDQRQTRRGSRVARRDSLSKKVSLAPKNHIFEIWRMKK